MFSPPRTIEKQRVFSEKATQSSQIIIIMPRNKIFNDLDHVRKDIEALKTPKGRPPDPWLLPTYVPLKINNPRTYSQGYLPNTVTPNNPYTIFSLFFNNKVIEILVRYTNKYTFLNPKLNTSQSRS